MNEQISSVDRWMLFPAFLGFLHAYQRWRLGCLPPAFHFSNLHYLACMEKKTVVVSFLFPFIQTSHIPGNRRGWRSPKTQVHLPINVEFLKTGKLERREARKKNVQLSFPQRRRGTPEEHHLSQEAETIWSASVRPVQHFKISSSLIWETHCSKHRNIFLNLCKCENDISRAHSYQKQTLCRFFAEAQQELLLVCLVLSLSAFMDFLAALLLRLG